MQMKWKTEEQLCESFRDWCAGRYDVHPECHGWDMVIVDLEGRRLGIQAKLADAPSAIAQCQEKMREGNVDCAAVLLPKVSYAIRRLCQSLGVGVVEPRSDPDENGRVQFFPTFRKQVNAEDRRRKPLPMTPSNLPAGVPSPRSIKDGEFMLEVIMHGRGGYLTNKDFQRVGWPERFPPKWVWKLKGRPRWEPTLTAVLPSSLDPKAYEAMRLRMEAKGVAKCT